MHLRAVPLLTGVIMTLSAMPLVAHHSWNTVFSEDKPLVLRGTLIKVELVNPHGWIWTEVKAPDGTITKWGVDMDPAVDRGVAHARHQGTDARVCVQ